MRNVLLSSVLALIALAGVTHAQAPTDLTLAIAGRSNSTPWIAASGKLVAIVWAAADTGGKAGDIYLATSRDGGRSFAAPVRVNAIAGEARISGEIAPRVSITPGSATPEIAVLWNAKAAVNAMRLARSKDGGRTFQAASTLQASSAAGDRGWGAMTLDANGNAHAIWLDHRGLAAGGEHAMHKGAMDGVAMAQKSALYYASVTAGGVRERSLFPGVCYCCKTALATGPDGALYAAWRHVFEGNFRDMAFTVSRDGGQTFAPMIRVNQDGWKIEGCPDDGPAMAIAASGTVHLVWPTVTNEKGVILYATSRDGRSFSKPVAVPTFGTPKASHPQIAIDGKGTVVIGWDELKGGVRNAGLIDAKTDAAGQVTFGTAQPLGEASTYPVLAGSDGGLVAAWTSGAPNQTVIKVRRVR